MRHLHLIAVICLASLLCGCVAKSVLVVDAAKVPIRGAEVEPITRSMNLETRGTDASGIVVLPRSPQAIEWVSVRKEGFDPSGQISVATKRRTIVVLQKTK